MFDDLFHINSTIDSIMFIQSCYNQMILQDIDFDEIENHKIGKAIIQ